MASTAAHFEENNGVDADAEFEAALANCPPDPRDAVSILCVFFFPCPSLDSLSNPSLSLFSFTPSSVFCILFHSNRFYSRIITPFLPSFRFILTFSCITFTFGILLPTLSFQLNLFRPPFSLCICSSPFIKWNFCWPNTMLKWPSTWNTWDWESCRVS